MSRLLIIIMLFISCPLFSQVRLDGKFERTSHKNIIWGETDYFWFDSTGSFKFLRENDNEDKEGKGQYLITHDTLFLYFENSDKTLFNIVSDYDSNNSDEIVYKLNIKDINTRKPLIGAIASIHVKYNDGYLIKERILTGTEADINGNLVITFKKIYLPCRLNINYIGHYECSYDITDTSNRDIQIYLEQIYTAYYSKNDTLSFQIRNITEDSFHLKKNEIIDWFLYEKTGDYNDK